MQGEQRGKKARRVEMCALPLSPKAPAVQEPLSAPSVPSGPCREGADSNVRLQT